MRSDGGTEIHIRPSASNGDAELKDEEESNENSKRDPHAAQEGHLVHQVRRFRLIQQLEPILNEEIRKGRGLQILLPLSLLPP